ncbi:MAG: HAD family phosphatase [Candidatus Omnitrophota bacterium]|nr:HAD family phosphatase [Candidatus Omnitrophota bacterium]
MNSIMSDKKIKAILFDLGNVIVTIDYGALEKGYASYGNFREGVWKDYATDSDNMNKYQEGKLTSSQFYSKTRRLFKMNIKYRDFYRIWNNIFSPCPEMEGIIRSFKKKYPDIRLILLSDTNEAHFEFIKREYEVMGLLDAHVVSYEFGRRKPHPDIYKEALKVAGALPKEIFYTDDCKDLIDAARVLGIRSYQFVGYEEFREQLAGFGIIVK